MFPSLLTRIAETALEVADAMLAVPAAEPTTMERYVHPHRRPPRTAGARVIGRPRRPGTIARPAQPCVSPITPVRVPPAPSTQRAPAA
jgi:hypothetical protein